MLTHPIKTGLLKERVVAYIADNPIAPLKTISRPAKESNIGIIRFCLCGFRVFYIGLAYALIDHLIQSVLVVFMKSRLETPLLAAGFPAEIS
jgi:hypothetical protein